MKNWIFLIILVAGVGWGVVEWQKSRGDKELELNTPESQTIAPVEQRDITFSIKLAGEITPAEQVSVRPEVNGRIDTLPVDIGDKVSQGQVLFTLDDKDLLIEIASRETEIESAKLQLEKARRDYERDKRLFEENLISREAFDNAKTVYQLAQNSIQQAERSLDLAKDRLDKTKIRAPFDCTILTRPVSVGQAVSGSGGFNSGTEVLTIADLNEMIINAHVNQADVTRLEEGMTVEVQVEAVPGLTLNGSIERIAPQATIKNGIKGFATRILLKNVDARVQPGMTANISIPVESASGVTSVPLSAVFTEYNQETGRMDRYAFVKLGKRYERRPVKIGVADYFNVEILSGLEAGEEVSLVKPDEELIVADPTAAVGSRRALPPGGSPSDT